MRRQSPTVSRRSRAGFSAEEIMSQYPPLTCISHLAPRRGPVTWDGRLASQDRDELFLLPPGESGRSASPAATLNIEPHWPFRMAVHWTRCSSITSEWQHGDYRYRQHDDWRPAARGLAARYLIRSWKSRSREQWPAPDEVSQASA